MSRNPTKAADNEFCIARKNAASFNDKLNSREGAAEILGIDRTRLARIELGSLSPYPEEAMLMTLLRKTAAEKAMTGAILRVVRALIGMKGQYTKTELTKPFVVSRVTFSPDYSDPEVRRAMLDQGMT